MLGVPGAPGHCEEQANALGTLTLLLEFSVTAVIMLCPGVRPCGLCSVREAQLPNLKETLAG